MRRVLALLLIIAALLIPGAVGAGGGLMRSPSTSNPGIQYPWRFGYCTDAHINWNFGGTTYRTGMMFGRMVDTLNTIGVDFMIMGGDWAEDLFTGNTQASVDSLTNIVARARFPMWPVMGNHEALASDTLLQRDPYYDSMRREPFASSFGGNPWHTKSWKNVDFIALEDNANRSINSGDDYRVNNPTTYAAPTGGVTGYDYHGITNTASPQRLALTDFLKNRKKSHWTIVAAHRPAYGSNANSLSRYSMKYRLRQDHFVKQVEDSMGTGERCLFLFGDQHIPLWFTKAIRDSALASSTGKGGYHLIVNGSGGARTADTTEVIGGTGMLSYLYSNAGSTANIGRTSTAWADTVTNAGYANRTRFWTWSLFTVYADNIRVDTFITFWPDVPNKYSKGGKHRLIDSRTITRDN